MEHSPSVHTDGARAVLTPKKPVISIAMAKESWHYGPLVVGGLAAGWGLYRIEDGGYGRKPCDIGGFTPDGKGVVLEVKCIQYRQSYSEPLPWKQFEPHQIGWLNLAAMRKAVPLVGLYTKSDGEMWIFRAKGVNTPAGHLRCSKLAINHLEDGTAYWGTEEEWTELLGGF